MKKLLNLAHFFVGFQKIILTLQQVRLGLFLSSFANYIQIKKFLSFSEIFFMKKNFRKLQSGSILLQAFFFGVISIIMIGALISWASANLKASRIGVYREQALQIAEAGIDYYRWHLAHDQNDYQDGTGLPGPYVHDFFDKDGVKIGTYTLEITAPPIGSTLVKVKSTGKVLVDPTVSRSILVQFAIPSLAKYAVVANDNMRFGENTEVFGPIHSNGGIRFDGVAHNIITSAKYQYDDPDHSGNQEFGVHTHVRPPPPTSGITDDSFRPLEAPPSGVPSRPDVFEIGRMFPVPAIDFTGFTFNLSQIKSDAQLNGKYFSSSGVQGYHIVLKINDTYDLYKVNKILATPKNCIDSLNQPGWGSWSIGNNGETLVGNYPFPENGLIFVEDNVWVDGQISTARITIAAGRFPDNPSTRPAITMNKNLRYTYYDGQDVIGLISQGNINVGMDSLNDLYIDAAFIAQNGRAGRYYYNPQCNPYHQRQTITLIGSVASNLRYGFGYSDNSGYQVRFINYDANLLYSPPPSYPLTSDQYQIVSWDEVR